MINQRLVQDYLKRAKIRFHALAVLVKAQDHPDVIRESQEIIELLQKAILMVMGIHPPKWHDTIDIILENTDKLPPEAAEALETLRRDSKWLRSQREIAFYGEADFLPLEGYSDDDAHRAINLVKQYFSVLDLMGLEVPASE